MKFPTKNDFMLFYNQIKKYELGRGARGIAYYNPYTKKVYKIFHQFFDYDKEFYVKYQEEEILRFSKVKTKTFIFPEEVISIGDEIIGYITTFAQGKLLAQTNPLLINLDKFTNATIKANQDVDQISKNNIWISDLMYNIIYGRKLAIIDSDEYGLKNYNDNIDELTKKNNKIFNECIKLFLIDCYFDEFVNNYKILQEMYQTSEVETVEFLKEFRKYLGEYLGKEIKYLREAKSCLNKEDKVSKLIRTLN